MVADLQKKPLLWVIAPPRISSIPQQLDAPFRLHLPGGSADLSARVHRFSPPIKPPFLAVASQAPVLLKPPSHEM